MARLKALLIGYGNVGKAVADRLDQIDVEPIGMIKSDSLVHDMDSNKPISTDTGACLQLKTELQLMAISVTL